MDTWYVCSDALHQQGLDSPDAYDSLENLFFTEKSALPFNRRHVPVNNNTS